MKIVHEWSGLSTRNFKELTFVRCLHICSWHSPSREFTQYMYLFTKRLTKQFVVATEPLIWNGWNHYFSGYVCLIFLFIGWYQVFPLLIEKFSVEEQASLVWQFLCSIPVNMMAEFLPWLSTSISPDESQDLRKCLSKIVPEEKLLQKVWFWILH